MPDAFDPRHLFDINGRVAVITGATGGLGSTMALGLAACGSRLVITGRNPEAVEEVASRIRERGGEAIGVAADITDPTGRERVIATAINCFGGIDILVNNAGVARRVRATKVTSRDYADVNGINAEAAFFLAQAAFPFLAASGHGSVVNVLSTGIWTGGAGSVLYRASKSTLHATTMVLAQEWAPEGVRVNALAPGAMDGGMGARLDQARIDHHLERIPQGRLGRPEELVPALLYLVSSASSFVTGTTLRVDGGAVAL